MKKVLRTIVFLFVYTVAVGIIYPLAIWAVSQLFFADGANGSLIRTQEGNIVGSALVGQKFESPGYFRGRPSAAGEGYDAGASSGSNLGPTNRKLIDRVTKDSSDLTAEHGVRQIPADLVTASSSGLDPHITPDAAVFQAERIAKARGVPVAAVEELIASNTEGRSLGLLGQPRVNVLLLNLALDRQYPKQPSAGPYEDVR